MSRIGKLPINIPAGVTVNVSDKNKVTVKGPKGSLERQIDQDAFCLGRFSNFKLVRTFRFLN